MRCCVANNMVVVNVRCRLAYLTKWTKSIRLSLSVYGRLCRPGTILVARCCTASIKSISYNILRTPSFDAKTTCVICNSKCYTGRGREPTCKVSTRSGLDELRVHKFLNNKFTLLKLLPPAFLLTVKRAALATLMDKTSHISRPELWPYEDYGVVTGWRQADTSAIHKTSLARANDQEHILWLHKRQQQELLLQQKGHPLLHRLSLPRVSTQMQPHTVCCYIRRLGH